MGRKIEIHELDALLSAAASRAEVRWPWLAIVVKGEGLASRVQVTGRHHGGTAELENFGGGWTKGCDRWSFSAYLGSMATHAGRTGPARACAKEAVDICDAVEFIVACLDGAYVEGDAPENLGRPISDMEEQAAEVLRRTLPRDSEAWRAMNVLLDGIVRGPRGASDDTGVIMASNID